ncbi:MAG: hypothetical protein B0D92_01475 [Spirochaeta sp. LUC14_002_19_P3]|nr:MAG: hypothetical protein B0D92_01475 [Spirochaeta sp. LUC14_002_19_P3]
MIRFTEIRPLFLAGITFLAATVCAQQEEGGNSALSVNQLLNDSLFIRAEVTISSLDTMEVLWSAQVKKITIPGREVIITLEKHDAKLNIHLTLYPTDNKRSMLAARSETWFGESYNSALTTFPVIYGSPVYYYPLGRASERFDTNPAEIAVEIEVSPYLDSLDKNAKADLKSLLDSAAKFKLTGEQQR